jgi:hypothetical protein
MGYDTRNPSFTFRFGEYRHGKLNKLAKAANMPTVDYVRSKILDPFIEGDLVPRAKDNLILEMSKLKLEKIKAEIEYLKLKNRYMETFGTPLSSAATRILKPQIITMPQQTTSELMSPYDEKNKRIQCVDCGILFTWNDRDEFLNQKYEFELHMTNKHGRAFTYLEKTVLTDLSFSGASI